MSTKNTILFLFIKESKNIRKYLKKNHLRGMESGHTFNGFLNPSLIPKSSKKVTKFPKKSCQKLLKMFLKLPNKVTKSHQKSFQKKFPKKVTKSYQGFLKVTKRSTMVSNCQQKLARVTIST